MHDPRTFWLTVTNIALGLALLVLVIGLATGTLCDLISAKRRKRAEIRDLDRELRDFLHNSPRHHPKPQS
ncbi:MAG TPA: hypothetical protein VKU19_33300 [Bryobacteraceae bacterium]|nr:hypothetical protein [Bryobacteraceae bacterium]